MLLSCFAYSFRFRAFENLVMKIIFWTRREGITRGWRIFFNEKLRIIITIWTLFIVLPFIKTRRFGDWNLSQPSSGTYSVRRERQRRQRQNSDNEK
jgi:hypothetical protein